ncbi:MAG: methyltransferase domain-containing protein, partial [Planctomycetes bacterium]|nr:methyltransferase domain-containing protein [Planctomycetota bacterium]
GCGDGRIVIEAAKKFGARGVGVDIDPQRIKECLAGAKKAKVEKLVEFRLADATKIDVSSATVLALYLLSESNELLRPRLEKQLKPGTRVVAHDYPVPGWKAKKVVHVRDETGKEHTLFLYIR